MFGWSEMKQKGTAPAAVQPSPPPPPPKDPPPIASVMAGFAEKMSNALGTLFGGKPKKLPQPVPCGGCGGIIWT